MMTKEELKKKLEELVADARWDVDTYLYGAGWSARILGPWGVGWGEGETEEQALAGAARGLMERANLVAEQAQMVKPLLREFYRGAVK